MSPGSGASSSVVVVAMVVGEEVVVAMVVGAEVVGAAVVGSGVLGSPDVCGGYNNVSIVYVWGV